MERPDRLPTLAADLAARKAAVIAATGSANPVFAAKASTATLPIVFTFAATPSRRALLPGSTRLAEISRASPFFASVLIER
jgi:hypothetical protein